MEAVEESNIETLDNQPCPFCNTNNLTLRQAERDIPYFGKVYVFSMSCSNCKYHKSDLELEESSSKPVKFTLEVSSEDDMNIRIIKSSYATVKIPRIGSIEPGPASSGYVTNVEGILNRIKTQVENFRENTDDVAEKKKAKNVLKKLQKIMWGQEKAKIIIEDPSGNSAIISDKAVKK